MKTEKNHIINVHLVVFLQNISCQFQMDKRNFWTFLVVLASYKFIIPYLNSKNMFF